MNIELHKVGKRYGRTEALDGISFALEPGQIVAVVGANGAGKTTLQRALAGIVGPDRGEILYDGERFNRGRVDLRPRLYVLPDFPFLFWEHDANQHAGMVLRISGCRLRSGKRPCSSCCVISICLPTMAGTTSTRRRAEG